MAYENVDIMETSFSGMKSNAVSALLIILTNVPEELSYFLHFTDQGSRLEFP